jgi:diguanylate cyclase (GGDEF)-like protein
MLDLAHHRDHSSYKGQMNWDPVSGANAAVWLAIVLGLQIAIVLLYRWANGVLPGLRPFLAGSVCSLASSMALVIVRDGASAWQSAISTACGVLLIVAPWLLYRAFHAMQRGHVPALALRTPLMLVLLVYLACARSGDLAARELVSEGWRVGIFGWTAWQAQYFRRVSQRHPALPAVAMLASLFPALGASAHIARVVLDVFERSPGWLTLLTSSGTGAVLHAVVGTLLTFVFMAAATCAIRDRYLEEARTFADQAERDPLTNLLNRRGLEQRLQRLGDTHHRTIGVLVLDVDYFKSINDRFGHLVGDQVLQTIALRLLATVRPGDLVCRFGGEEFVVVVPCRDPEDVHVMATRLRHAIGGEAFQAADQFASITISIGLAFGALDDSDALLRDADERVLQAKHVGRNTIVLPGDGRAGARVHTGDSQPLRDAFEDESTGDLFGVNEAPV